MVNIIHTIKVRLNFAKTSNFKVGLETARAGIIKTTKDLKHFNTTGGKIGATVGIMSKRFQMWALSMMFTSMMLQRLFTSISKAATSAFTKVMESSGFAGSAIQQLGVQFEYLKFIVGSAINRVLLPLMPIINKIVSWLTKWIQKHPKLTVALLGLIAVLGTLLGVVSLVVLNLTWLVPVLEAIGVAIAFAISPIGIMMLLFIGLIALIIYMMVKMGGFKQFWKNVWQGIKNIFVIIWDSLVTAGAWGFNLLIAGIITLIDWINKAIRGMNNLFGTNISTISTKGLYNAMSDYEQGDIITAYSDKIADEKRKELDEAGSDIGGEDSWNFNIENLNVESNSVEELLAEIQANYGVGG